MISDTHGLLRPEVFDAFARVDHILHAGDIGSEDVLLELRSIAPVTACAGNVDGFRCADAGELAKVELGGLRFLCVHVLDRPRSPRPALLPLLKAHDVVVFGHSHLPHDERVGGVWFFNPASAGPRRFDYPVTVGIFEERRGKWSARHVPLDARSGKALPRYLNQLSRRA